MLLSGCAPAATPTAAPDSLSIGITFDEPGLGFRDADGTLTGFDAEVARYVARHLGYGPDQITWVEARAAQRESLVQSDQVKLVVAGYSITDLRAEKVTFAGPYLTTHQDLLVRADDHSIRTPADLAGKRVCSVVGATASQVVRLEHRDADLLELETYSKCIAALEAGSTDALVTDDVVLAGFAADPDSRGRFRLVGHPFGREHYGIGLKKGDLELCERVSDALRSMVSSGAWHRAAEATLGASGHRLDPAENPPSVAACR